MESLALLVSLMLLVIYLSGLIAFGLSWLRNRIGKILTLIFGSISVLSGAWVAITLISGNGLMVGGIPVLLGALSIWNTLRVNKPKAS
ncbi:MAG: hypothetical protein ACK5CU_04425 [Rhodoluna sp.]